MLFLSLYKRLLWCLKCRAFINLGKINVFTPQLQQFRAFNPVQQYGQLKPVTIEMEKLYRISIISPFHLYYGYSDMRTNTIEHLRSEGTKNLAGTLV